MDLSRLDPSEKRVLRALFELAQRDHPARPDVLARVLDLEVSRVAHLLGALAQQRLVDERTRLTLTGLAVAARIPALPRALHLRVPADEPRAVHLRTAAEEPRASAWSVDDDDDHALGA